MTSRELLMKLTLASGVSGFEEKISEIMIDKLGDKAQYKKDNIGSIAFEFAGSSEKPRIMVVGHQDEIGFIVTHVLGNGLLKFHNLGGWDWRTLLSSPVNIINDKDEHISGVIGSIPIHYTRDKVSKEMKISDMFIDIGAKSDEDVIENFGINIGSPVVPATHFVYQEKNNMMFSKAFDDRVGIAAAIELGEFLAETSHPNTVYCCGSVQEEVGVRGARTISSLVKPDIAIIVEGVPADDFPGNESKSKNKLGCGAHLRLFDPSYIIKPKLYRFAIDLAKKNDIPVQPIVRTSGGTDAKEIHLSGTGVPCLVLGVPVRYAHSNNCIMSLDDYESCIELVKQLVLSIDAETFKGLT